MNYLPEPYKKNVADPLYHLGDVKLILERLQLEYNRDKQIRRNCMKAIDSLEYVTKLIKNHKINKAIEIITETNNLYKIDEKLCGVNVLILFTNRPQNYNYGHLKLNL